MEAAKDLLQRAVELDSALKYSEALVCYEQGIQNLLRAMGGTLAPTPLQSARIATLVGLTPLQPPAPAECRTDAEKKDLRRKAEEYLERAEQIKKTIKERESRRQDLALLRTWLASGSVHGC